MILKGNFLADEEGVYKIRLDAENQAEIVELMRLVSRLPSSIVSYGRVSENFCYTWIFLPQVKAKSDPQSFSNKR